MASQVEPPQQLLLGIRLDDDATFASFHGAANVQLVEFLQDLGAIPDPHLVILWGSDGSGRTHLLQAMCHHAAEQGVAACYLPLADHQQLTPGILDGLESLALVCLDDLQAVAGNTAWEHSLFSLLNRARDSSTVIVAAADRVVSELALDLADLASRLQAGVLFRVWPLSDADKQELLILRAQGLGMVLDPQVARFVLQRSGRSVPELLAVLQKLDTHSLEQQRAITIPLVKAAMGW